MADKSNPKKFIQGAIKRPGALTRKAKEAGKTVTEFARDAVKPGSKASSTTKRQAMFFLRVLKPAVRKRSKK